MGLTLTDAKREILSLIDEEPRHGYVIAQELGKQGPTVYEHLGELEDAGYVTSEPDDRRKVYSLTDRGELVVEAERADGA
jgi:DNA-binding PadR family transcriptional regulator